MACLHFFVRGRVQRIRGLLMGGWDSGLLELVGIGARGGGSQGVGGESCEGGGREGRGTCILK